MSEALNDLAALISAKRSDAVVSAQVTRGELTVVVQAAHLEEFIEFL